MSSYEAVTRETLRRYQTCVRELKVGRESRASHVCQIK